MPICHRHKDSNNNMACQAIAYVMSKPNSGLCFVGNIVGHHYFQLTTTLYVLRNLHRPAQETSGKKIFA